MERTAQALAAIVLAATLSGCDGRRPGADAAADGGADADADADADAGDGAGPPCPDDMALVDDGLGAPFCIDRFEHPGQGQEPLTGVPWYRAREACVVVRKELCEEDLWARACVGTSPAACVGPVGPSGARPDCASGFGVFDMAGNVAEWTASPGGAVSWFVRGGSARDAEIGCEVREEVLAEDRRSDLGLRCCRVPRR